MVDKKFKYLSKNLDTCINTWYNIQCKGENK